MSRTGNATFGIDSWDEKPWHEGENGRKLTRATVAKTYHGDLEGRGTMEYVMSYADETRAVYVGIERVVGRLAGAEGSFVMTDRGTFENGVAASSFDIVEGSGTEQLVGIRGTASVDATDADEQRLSIEYDLD